LVQIGSSTSDYEHSTNCLFNLYAFDHQIYPGREERNVMILPANGNHGSDCYSVYSSDCARKNAQPWTAETQFRSGANYRTTERL